MKNLFVRFMKDDSGATAIEYGLIAAGISVAIVAIVGTVGTKLVATFTTVSRRGPVKFGASSFDVNASLPQAAALFSIDVG
jgi:pilus assembly protein Flp/PilA